MALDGFRDPTSEAYIREALYDQEKAERDRISIIQEAKEIGMEEGMEKVILNMNQKGFAIEVIADAVNMSIDEIEKIINKA